MDAFLPLAWAVIIGFCIIMYVILDGFTLGTAMLLPFLSSDERDLAVSVILPTWDGNQTWLILGSAALYGAFPAAFSILLPVFYLPLFIMVTGLIFRGVVFEFRLKDRSHVHQWDKVFIIASGIVALTQGLLLGDLVSGVEFTTSPLIQSTTNLATPFSLFTAVSLIFGYLLLGASRLIYKTEGELQKKMYKLAPYLCLAVLLSIGVVSFWTPMISSIVYSRWFSHDNWIVLAILPYLSLITMIIFLFSIKRRDEHLPFLCAVAFFAYAFIGYLISIYPYIVPYSLTIWQTAAPTGSLNFMMIGAVIMLPVLLVYTGYAYHIFRGKVQNVFHY